MRRWLTAILVGCALVALRELPPEALPSVEPRGRGALEARHGALVGEVQVTAETLRRYLWSDSLSALVVARAVDGSALVVPDEASLGADVTAALDAMIREHVRAVDPMPGAPLFGYVYQPHGHGRIEGRPYSTTGRTEVYAGELDGTAYCLQVRTVDPARVRAVAQARLSGTTSVTEPVSTVGSCRPHLRHGLPGPRVEAWLEEGALALAGRAGEPVDADARPLLERLLERRHLPFGVSVFAGSSVPVDVDRCMTGDAAACGRLMLDPGLASDLGSRQLEIARRSPAASLGTLSPYAAWLPEHDFYLYDLESRFGREAFRAFWTSEAPVDEAFVSAFGMPIGAWTVEWLDGVAGLDDPGPRLPRSAATGTFLTVALLLGIAYTRQRRRQVG